MPTTTALPAIPALQTVIPTTPAETMAAIHADVAFYAERKGPASSDWRCSFDGAYMSECDERCRRCQRAKAEAL